MCIRDSQKVDEALALRLVWYYGNALRQNLTAHDKIEFEIVFTTYDFGDVYKRQDQSH